MAALIAHSPPASALDCREARRHIAIAVQVAHKIYRAEDRDARPLRA
jgi:hypothetical protein